MSRPPARKTAPPAPPLNAGPHEALIGQQLLELYAIYVRTMANRTDSPMIHLNLTQWRTLTLIGFNPDQTQRALAQTIGIDPSSMTPIIDLFERRKWVRRHASKENRSAYRIRLTPEGETAFARLAEEMADIDRRFAEELGEQGAADFAATLQRMRAAFAGQLAGG